MNVRDLQNLLLNKGEEQAIDAQNVEGYNKYCNFYQQRKVQNGVVFRDIFVMNELLDFQDSSSNDDDCLEQDSDNEVSRIKKRN